ncbi:MAG: phage terminase large subunit family protein, partial [Nannocystaceae bacterium]
MVAENPIVRFAEKHYELGSDSSVSGKYRVENSPWARGIFDALVDPNCKEVTAQIGAQMGKNLIGEIWTGWIISEAPGNMLIYGQTDDDVALYYRDRLIKRLETLDILKPFWPGKNDVRMDQIHFPHMYILALGANDSNTQGKSARYILNDEVHLWGPGKLDQARDRCTAFWDAK